MTPDLAKVLEKLKAGSLRGVRVALPGKILAYDKAKQSAVVQPLIDDVSVDPVDGSLKATEIPPLNDVPVAFPGAGGYSETWPVAKGDLVLLVFCSSSIARWKLNGGRVDPADDRHHALPDAIAYAGVRDLAHALTGVPDDAWVITVPTGKQIRLGSSTASDPVVRKSDMQRFLVALQAAIASLSAAPIPAAALAALKTALEAPTPTASDPIPVPWVVGMDSNVKVK